MIQPCPAALFGNRARAAEGWYWAFLSSEVKRGKARALNLLGHELVIWRGRDGIVAAADAYCPHMGAHLAEGDVDADGIRCRFHGWRYDRQGRCTRTPGSGNVKVSPLTVRPAAEGYGLIWIWFGRGPARPLPEVPELAGREVRVLRGNRFRKNCHPNVVLINAIDEHHFNTVHPLVRRLTDGLRFEMDEADDANIRFRNAAGVQPGAPFRRLLARMYKGPVTYAMSYWNGATGTVTLGPDFQRFHILFALRPDPEGRTEGQTMYLTARRRSWAGRMLEPLLLRATRVVGNYFAKGDSEIFRSIRFDFRTPTSADKPIIRFIRHYEKQPSFPWGRAPSAGETRDGETAEVRSAEVTQAIADPGPPVAPAAPAVPAGTPSDRARTVLITGASSGFGLAMTRAFLAEGWSVLACLRRAGERQGLFAAESARHGGALRLVELDSASEPDRDALARLIASEYGGRLDGAILNAGYALFGAVEDAGPAELRLQMEVNALGPMLQAQALAPYLRAACGRLILMSSMMGYTGLPLSAAYAAGKFALEGFGESLALELAPKGVQVCVVQPGGFRTRFGQNIAWAPGGLDPASPYHAESEAYRARVRARLARPGRDPAAVAEAVLGLFRRRRMPVRLKVGGDAKLMAWMRRLLPEAAYLGALARMSGAKGK